MFYQEVALFFVFLALAGMGLAINLNLNPRVDIFARYFTFYVVVWGSGVVSMLLALHLLFIYFF